MSRQSCSGDLLTVEGLRAELERLRRQLTHCNLAAVKQAAALKDCSNDCASLGQDTIVFHEPFEYLDPMTKELVLHIVAEKMRLVSNHHAPPSLLNALAPILAAPRPVAKSNNEEIIELQEELEETKNQLKDAEAKAKTAEAEAQKSKARAEAAEAKAKGMESELQQLRAETTSLKALLQQKEDELREAKEELAKLQEEVLELNSQLQAEIAANSTLRQQLEQVARELQTAKDKAAKFETMLLELQAQYDVLEKEAKEMREELARRNNTRTKSCQTTMTGTQIEEQVEEIKRLSLMLEELQTKLKELLEECGRQQLGGKVMDIARKLGLESVIVKKTVFERLYTDAQDRVRRLENLREKLRKDKEALTGKAEPEEPSVMSIVETSQKREPPSPDEAPVVTRSRTESEDDVRSSRIAPRNAAPRGLLDVLRGEVIAVRPALRCVATLDSPKPPKLSSQRSRPAALIQGQTAYPETPASQPHAQQTPHSPPSPHSPHSPPHIRGFLSENSLEMQGGKADQANRRRMLLGVSSLPSLLSGSKSQTANSG